MSLSLCIHSATSHWHRGGSASTEAQRYPGSRKPAGAARNLRLFLLLYFHRVAFLLVLLEGLPHLFTQHTPAAALHT